MSQPLATSAPDHNWAPCPPAPPHLLLAQPPLQQGCSCTVARIRIQVQGVTSAALGEIRMPLPCQHF